MKTTRVEKDVCPVCNSTLDSFSSITDNEPTVGDLSICIHCLSYLEISENLKLKELSVDDFVNLPNDVSLELMKMRKVLAIQKSNRSYEQS